VTHKNPKLVFIRWHDAQAETGWDDRTDEDIEVKVLVLSVGWLVAENDHSILLAGDVGEGCSQCSDSGYDGSTNRTTQIPKACIEDVFPVAVSEHSVWRPYSTTGGGEIAFSKSPDVEKEPSPPEAETTTPPSKNAPHIPEIIPPPPSPHVLPIRRGRC